MKSCPFVICVAVALLAGCQPQDPAPTSTLIINAMIIDGTGSPGFEGAVRMDDDRIVETGDLTQIPGETIFDASGLVLAPGFIDTHSHHDGDSDEYPHMPAVLSQGVTTIIRGSDGGPDLDEVSGYISQADINQGILDHPIAVNIAVFSGHGSLRAAVMGDDYRRHATATEIEAMQALLEEDMRAGAIGLGAGLEYEPGIYASTEEIIELAKVAARYGGGYSSHLRDEDDRFMDALEEIVRVGREAKLRVHVAHIKLADNTFWGTSDDVIQLLESARADGVEISADIYPYLRWQSNLAVLFPDRDYTNRDTAVFTFEHTSPAQDIVLIDFPENPNYNGMSIAEIAHITETDVVSTLLDLAAAAGQYRKETGKGGSSIIAKGMDENDVVKLMQWRYTNICSDGSHESGHPRGWGSFPRVFRRFVRELGTLELEEAVYKMTGLSADSMGIKNRGRLLAGAYADLVLFDPDRIADHATMAESTLVSVGVVKVWVNGQLAFDDGQPTGQLVGRVVTLADSTISTTASE